MDCLLLLDSSTSKTEIGTKWAGMRCTVRLQNVFNKQWACYFLMKTLPCPAHGYQAERYSRQQTGFLLSIFPMSHIKGAVGPHTLRRPTPRWDIQCAANGVEFPRTLPGNSQREQYGNFLNICVLHDYVMQGKYQRCHFAFVHNKSHLSLPVRELLLYRTTNVCTVLYVHCKCTLNICNVQQTWLWLFTPSMQKQINIILFGFVFIFWMFSRKWVSPTYSGLGVL